MGGQKKKRSEAAMTTLLATLGCFVLGFYSAAQDDWITGVWLFAAGIAIVGWLFAIRAPTFCNVETLRGHPCPNRTNGILFGCGSANHTWDKFFLRFGWRRRRARSGRLASQPQPGPPSTDKSAEPVVVRIQGDGKATIVFWCTLVCTLTALIGATTDLAALVS